MKSKLASVRTFEAGLYPFEDNRLIYADWCQENGWPWREMQLRYGQ